MTLLAHVKHFLNPEGMSIFPQWFNRTAAILKQQSGFISLRYALDPQEADCVNLWIEFDSFENLAQWSQTDLHKEVVGALDPYRIKPWQSMKYKIAVSIYNTSGNGDKNVK